MKNATLFTAIAVALVLGHNLAQAADPRLLKGPASGNNPSHAAVVNPSAQQGGADSEAPSPVRKSGAKSLSPTHKDIGGTQQPQAQGIPGAAPRVGGVRNPGAGAMIKKDIQPIPRPDTMRSPDAAGQGRTTPRASGPRNPGAGVMINKDIQPIPRPDTMRSVGDDSQMGTAPQQRKIPNPTAPGAPASPAASGDPQAGPRNPGAGVMINKDIMPLPRPDTTPSTDGGSQQPGRPLPGAGPRPQP